MKKKFLAFTLGSMIVTGGIVGGTFAYFSDSESSTGNVFQAGEIELSGFRNDSPIEGPMFYTDSDYTTPNGILGTGEWKPGDSHTRGMFIQNTGDIDVKLRSITATPTSGSDTAAATEFAKQANLTLSIIKPGDRALPHDQLPFIRLTDTEYAAVVKALDEFYKTELDNVLNNLNIPPGATLEQKRTIFNQALAMVKTTLLNRQFETDVNGESVRWYVEDIYQGLLETVLNQEFAVPTQYELNVGEARYLGYTVTFMDLDPSENNKLQGKEIKLDFTTDWIQQ